MARHGLDDQFVGAWLSPAELRELDRLIPNHFPEQSDLVRQAVLFLLHVYRRNLETTVARVRDYLGGRKASSDPTAIALHLQLDEHDVREALQILAKEREAARRTTPFWAVRD